ncbi:MAG: hypothetical protein LBD04_02820 [Synergistaceae bacterium]|nr:hypothetical protein [Synergistaceae bacterium]
MPGVIDVFRKQAVVWEKRIPGSEDVFGNPQYELGVEIKARITRKRKTFTTAPGEVIVTTRVVMTTDDVKTGDRLTYEGDSFVIRVGPNEARWIDGKWWGAWCYG